MDGHLEELESIAREKQIEADKAVEEVKEAFTRIVDATWAKMTGMFNDSRPVTLVEFLASKGYVEQGETKSKSPKKVGEKVTKAGLRWRNPATGDVAARNRHQPEWLKNASDTELKEWLIATSKGYKKYVETAPDDEYEHRAKKYKEGK